MLSLEPKGVTSFITHLSTFTCRIIFWLLLPNSLKGEILANICCHIEHCQDYSTIEKRRRKGIRWESLYISEFTKYRRPSQSASANIPLHKYLEKNYKQWIEYVNEKLSILHKDNLAMSVKVCYTFPKSRPTISLFRYIYVYIYQPQKNLVIAPLTLSDKKLFKIYS